MHSIIMYVLRHHRYTVAHGVAANARIERARRVRGRARALAGRGRQRDRNSFACTSMSVLRRPDDHRRNIRRRAPGPVFSTDPHQDRHFMIAIAILPASQRRSASRPAAPRSRRALPSHRPQTLSKRLAHARPSYARDRTRSSPTFPSIRMAASSPRSRTRTRDPSATFKSP